MEKVKYQCKNVIASSHTLQNLSRHDLLQWINDALGVKVKKVECLCSGAVYCQMMNILFPGCVALKRVKLEATTEYEYNTNLKELQKAFSIVGCDKGVPIERLVKGRFQENFEFLQWFKRFFDANFDSAMPCSVPKQSEKPLKQNTSVVRPVVPIHSAPRQTNAAQNLESQVINLQERAEMIERERDFYYTKLRNIETFVAELSSEPETAIPDKNTIVSKILAEIYATDDDEQPEQPEINCTF